MNKKGYKAMYSGKCLDQQYEVGKTYKLIPKLVQKTSMTIPIQFEIKKNVLGFHYCLDPNDVVFHYNIKRLDFELYEILDMNPSVELDGDTQVTDEIKIVRKIERNEYHKIFTNSYFELVGISRIYVWDNNCYGNFDRMIERVEVK